jgi:hypothetical protein
MPQEARERLDATLQRILRERYGNVIPLVSERDGCPVERIAPRRAVRPGAFRRPAPDRPAA